MKALLIVLVVIIALFMAPYVLLKILGEEGYDSEECLRLQHLVGDENLRVQLIQWVDNELDLESLGWFETDEETSGSHGNHPGLRAILKPEFDFSILGFALEGKYYDPEVRLVAPDAWQGNSQPFSNTKSVAFSQVLRTAILVQTTLGEDFGVDPQYFKRVDGRVAVYCEPRD